MNAISRAGGLALVTVLALLGCAGCNEHLLGTHDVAITYAVRGRGLQSMEDLRSNAELRLSAAMIGATVEAPRADVLRVVVDSDEVEAVDTYLRWRGGLAIYRPLSGADLSLPGVHGLTARTAHDGDGTVERYFEGSPAAIGNAVLDTHLPQGQRLLVQYVDHQTLRTRLVADPPLADLSTGVERVDSLGGNVLEVTLTQSAGEQLEALRNRLGGARVAIARDRAVLAWAPLPASGPIHSLSLRFGDDIYSYSRAWRSRLLLRTLPLPELHRLGSERLPTNWPLAIAGLVLPMILSLAWLFFVRRFDRANPEPLWIVLATFALGCLSVLPAGLIEYALMRSSPYLDPSIMTFGGQVRALPIALAVFTFVVGMSEEGSKFLATWVFAARRREFDEPVDGIVYGAAAALGFAALENVKYFAHGRLAASLIVARTFLSIPAHLFFGAIWGYALGRKLVSRRTSVLLFFLFAALMHGAFDTLLSIDHMAIVALALNIVLATLFVTFLRRSLRYGVVGHGGEATPPDERETYRVGLPGRFALSVVGFYVLAFALSIQGAAIEYGHRRVDAAFVVTASVMIALLAFVAYRISSDMPLDVVLDARGVTFAGATRSWESIDGIDRVVTRNGQRSYARLRSREGELILGPADVAKMDAVGRAVYARLTSLRGPVPGE